MREVRTPTDLEGLDALVMPGGESTTMTLGIEREGLAGPLTDLIRLGRPVLATCAGLIMLDRGHLGLLDVTARRNAFGRQLHSFEATLEIDGLGPVTGVFIRAPWWTSTARTSRCSPSSRPPGGGAPGQHPRGGFPPRADRRPQPAPLAARQAGVLS